MSTCGKVKEGDEEGIGREASGQMSWSPPGGGGTSGVAVGGGTGLSDQDQLVENGVCDGWASHSDSAWRDIASRRYLRMRAAAKADEGKVVVSGEEEEDEEKELEDIVWAAFGGELGQGRKEGVGSEGE